MSMFDGELYDFEDNNTIAAVPAAMVLKLFSKRYNSTKYDKTISKIFRLRPEIFDIFEASERCLRQRVAYKGILYLIESEFELDELGEEKKNQVFAELVIQYSKQEDLPILMSLNNEIKARIDAYNRESEHSDGAHTWMEGLSLSSVKEEKT